MLTIHHLGLSQSDRIVWLCEELGVPYSLVRYARDPVLRTAPVDYKALHPFGTAPVIADGDLVLGETGAIFEYLMALHDGGRLAVSPDSPNFGDYLYWMHFANGSLMPSMMLEMAANILAPGQENGATQAFRQRADRAFTMIEDRLQSVPYFAGPSFTAADIMMLFPLTTMRLFVPRDISPLPHLLAYLQRVARRPALLRAMSRADPGLSLPLT
jgi:glutathione S-transferase